MPGPGEMNARSPLYEAHHGQRYERQGLIQQYQDKHQCRLVVVADILMSDSVTLFEETLYDADPSQDLHVMLATPGGHGETAIRLVRQAQYRCKELTVIVPDQAKSAGTLFVLGANHIYMGPTSDLGPVDPQFLRSDGSPVSARAIIDAVEDAERRIQENPQTYPLHATLLADTTALMVRQARDELDRTTNQVKEALSCVQERTEEEIEKLAQKLHGPLIDETKSHGTTVSAKDAKKFGLPVREADHNEQQWQDIWRLWMKYRVLGEAMKVQVYEGQSVSFVQLRP